MRNFLFGSGMHRLKAQVKALLKSVASLKKRILELETQNSQLRQALAAAQKNSRNSSKPPSSDIVKPPPKEQNKKRKKKPRRGAQKGHPKHERLSFAPERIDQRIAHRLDRCPFDASHNLIQTDQVQSALQQIELVAKPFVITEHLTYRSWCPDCHQYHCPSLPAQLRAAGLFGPRLTTLVVYLKGKLHSSYSGIQDFLNEVCNLQVSRGYLAKLMQKAAAALATPYTQLLEALPQQININIDETGHKENGKRLWTWCFRASNFVLFKIANRSADVLLDVLGPQFKGILGADYYSAYRKYARLCGVLVQFCLAHLIRDVKYLCEFPDRHVQQYGQGLLRGLRLLFATLHRKDQLSPDQFQLQLAQAEDQIWEAAMAPRASPISYGGPQLPRFIENMVQRFIKHGEGYFQFITNPQIDPTNNSAEQAIRFVVQDRAITQGTRSQRGRQICERLWTVMGTCKFQNRSAFVWILNAISAHYNGQQPPSLLPDSNRLQS
jgi:transposase